MSVYKHLSVYFSSLMCLDSCGGFRGKAAVESSSRMARKGTVLEARKDRVAVGGIAAFPRLWRDTHWMARMQVDVALDESSESMSEGSLSCAPPGAPYLVVMTAETRPTDTTITR